MPATLMMCVLTLRVCAFVGRAVAKELSGVCTLWEHSKVSSFCFVWILDSDCRYFSFVAFFTCSCVLTAPANFNVCAVGSDLAER